MTVRRTVLSVMAAAGGAIPATAQPPVRELPPATAVSTERITSTLDVREMNGRVVVTVVEQRRLISFDTTLRTFVAITDSGESARIKLPLAPPVIGYLGDSLLIPDNVSRSFLVVDALGNGSRVMAPVKALDFFVIGSRRTGSSPVADARGRLTYRGNPVPPPRSPDPAAPPPPQPDSAPIVRSDFDSRAIDTLGKVRIPTSGFTVSQQGTDGNFTATRFVDPIPPATDEWAVTSDGHLAIVRGVDYHIDWVMADGSRKSTPKMPYDWRRLSDADKQARVDSAKHVVDSLRAIGRDPYEMRRIMVARTDTIHPTVIYARPDQMADYYPPLRAGSVLADADGNLWILPTTSAQVGAGLLYDVVNNKGEVFQRVRAPKDRIIVGFGRGGVVYTAALIAPNEWVLERTRMPLSS